MVFYENIKLWTTTTPQCTMARKKKKIPAFLHYKKLSPETKKNRRKLFNKKITWKKLKIGRVFDLENLPD